MSADENQITRDTGLDEFGREQREGGTTVVPSLANTQTSSGEGWGTTGESSGTGARRRVTPRLVRTSGTRESFHQAGGLDSGDEEVGDDGTPSLFPPGTNSVAARRGRQQGGGGGGGGGGTWPEDYDGYDLSRLTAAPATPWSPSDADGPAVKGSSTDYVCLGVPVLMLEQ